MDLLSLQENTRDKHGHYQSLLEEDPRLAVDVDLGLGDLWETPRSAKNLVYLNLQSRILYVAQGEVGSKRKGNGFHCSLRIIH